MGIMPIFGFTHCYSHLASLAKPRMACRLPNPLRGWVQLDGLPGRIGVDMGVSLTVLLIGRCLQTGFPLPQLRRQDDGEQVAKQAILHSWVRWT